MRRFDSPYFQAQVELTDEREAHIARRHPDLLPRWIRELEEAISQPDDIGLSSLDGNLLFARWADTIRGGRYVVAVVATDPGDPPRHWIVTGYLARRVPIDLR